MKEFKLMKQKHKRRAAMNNIQTVRVSFTNSFLLKCKGGYLLIDTGFPGEYDLFLKKLSKININISDIRYLLLTHYHDDHAGFAAEVVRDSGAKIITHKNAVPLLEKGEELIDRDKFLNSCVKFIIQMHAKLSHRKQQCTPIKASKDDYILDGDNLELLKEIGIDGKILYTPGHTDDSISVLLSDGSAIVGDAAMNFLNICHTKYRPIYAEDYAEVYKSWEKLINYKAKIIYPAHGGPFDVKKLELQLAKREIMKGYEIYIGRVRNPAIASHPYPSATSFICKTLPKIAYRKG